MTTTIEATTTETTTYFIRTESITILRGVARSSSKVVSLLLPGDLDNEDMNFRAETIIEKDGLAVFVGGVQDLSADTADFHPRILVIGQPHRISGIWEAELVPIDQLTKLVLGSDEEE